MSLLDPAAMRLFRGGGLDARDTMKRLKEDCARSFCLAAIMAHHSSPFPGPVVSPGNEFLSGTCNIRCVMGSRSADLISTQLQ
jgi:hypothetical protein